jgi:hypothetical protein
MAFKLKKGQISERDALAVDIRAKAEALDAAIRAYNEGLEMLAEGLTNAAEAYNESLSDVREFVSGIAEDGRAEFDEKSERWRAGEKGQEADSWVQAWEAVEIEDFEFETPEPIDEIDPSELGGTLEDLPEAPE